MTLIEAINRIDALKPNGYSQEQKVSWLSKLDTMLFNEVINTHLPLPEEEFQGYDTDTDLETELIVGQPYDDIYVSWLEAQIDYANAEYIKYNNSITRYNDLFQAWANYYNRTHMPVKTRVRYF